MYLPSAICNQQLENNRLCQNSSSKLWCGFGLRVCIFSEWGEYICRGTLSNLATAGQEQNYPRRAHYELISQAESSGTRFLWYSWVAGGCLLLVASLEIYNSNNNKVIKHGSCFEVWLNPRVSIKSFDLHCTFIWIYFRIILPIALKRKWFAESELQMRGHVLNRDNLKCDTMNGTVLKRPVFPT